MEQAKQIRKEIKDKYTTKDGWKFSITSDYNSINVTVLESPHQILSDEFIDIYKKMEAGESVDIFSTERYTPEFAQAYEDIREIMDGGQINYNAGDPGADYARCNYYTNLSVKDKLQELIGA